MDSQNETQPFNRNDKQLHFNQIKGVIYESNDGDNGWCSLTLNLGHENARLVNIAVKKQQYDKIKDAFPIGTRVVVLYYLTSRFKNFRWYTSANLLQIDKG